MIRGPRPIMSPMSRSSRTSQRGSVRNITSQNAAFKEYRQRTGAWPVLSIAVYAARFVLMFAAISFVFWYGQLHAESNKKVAIGFLLLALPGIFLWTALETFVWNYDLRRKQLTSPGTYLTTKQFPGK
jgi:hypothetical protein